MLKFKKQSQRGDTIVEVLIAIAVASSVLAVTYGAMNRNLLITRDSQERTEATKIAQGQIELFKLYRDQDETKAYTGNFCLDSTTTNPIVGFTGGSPTATLPDDFTHYPAACVDTVTGFYHYGIVADVATPGSFKFYVRWDRVDGIGQDQVLMVYRR